jgi:anti-sigma factor RsiW
MSRECPKREDLTRLLDGEATENQAARMRAHAASCPRCEAELAQIARLVADISAPAPGPAPEVEAGVALLMRRIEAGAAAPAAPRARRYAALGAGAAALALAAAAALLAVLPGLSGAGAAGERPRGPEAGAAGAAPEGVFAPRGAAGPGPLSRDVGLTLYRLSTTPTPLAPGAEVAPDAAYTAGFRSLRRSGVYVSVFAVDAAGDIHWLYPGYTDPASDPESLALPYAAAETALPESVILESPAPGALRFLSIIAEAPLRVSEIERLPPRELTAEALKRRFPRAEIQELTAFVAAPK